MLEMIGVGKRVLELGCSNGYMSRLLKQRNCQVTGLDVDPLAAAEARAFCEEVIVADLDARPLVDLLPGTPFDVAVFGDVLEHLRDPWRILDEARAFLAPGSFAVLSIPNVAHGSVRLALLQGSFDYQPQGLLDSTHLRFFTLRSVRELCMRSGYRIEEIRRTKADIFAATDLLPSLDPNDFDEALLAQIRKDPEHDTIQFVIKAVPLSDEEKISAMVTRVSTLELELRGTADKAERLQSELDAIRTETSALLVQNNQLAQERRAADAEFERERDDLRAEIAKAQSLAESEREMFSAAFEEHRGIVEAEVRGELERLEEDLRDRRETVADLTAALTSAQQMRDSLSAELRYYQARIGEFEAIRETASQFEQRNVSLTNALEEEQQRAAELAADLELRERTFQEVKRDLERELAGQEERFAFERGELSIAAESRAGLLEAELNAARGALATVEAELDSMRRERTTSEASVLRLHQMTLERTRSELQKVLEEIALTDAAIQATYRSRLWTLKRLFGLMRRSSGGKRRR